MTERWQSRLIGRLVEGVPSLVFLGLWRLGADLELAGWIGAALAVLVIAGMRWAGRPADTLMLGINVHIAAITPLITVVFYGWSPDLAHQMADYSWIGVLLSVGIVGAGLTAFTRAGFTGVPAGTPAARIRASLIMIAGAALGLGWGIAFIDIPAISFAPPMMALCVLRGVLIRRLRRGDGHVPKAMPQPKRA